MEWSLSRLRELVVKEGPLNRYEPQFYVEKATGLLKERIEYRWLVKKRQGLEWYGST